MLVGYARISTTDQSLDPQIDALKKAGCEKIFTDVTSGANDKRIGLDEAMEYIREGDSLVIWRLDRLGRSLQHLIDIFELFKKRNIGIRSLSEQLDTTTATGNLLFHIFCSLAEFERGLISERTKAGLAAARARGRIGGRKKVMTDTETLQAMIHDYNTREISVAQIAKKFHISKATVHRYVHEYQ